MSNSRSHRSMFSVKTPHAWPGARIGIMGGSFNPPHEGHLAVANTAIRRLGLDRLWWLVSPGNPLKSHDGLPSLQTRISSSEDLANNPRMVVTGFESELGSAYTAATIGFLRSRFPKTDFVWVMGADNFATFHHWKHWRGIAATAPMAIVDRPRWHLRALTSPTARTFWRNRIDERRAMKLPSSTPPAWVFLSTRLSEQSSTALRSDASE